jgi:hypothetical protein
VRALAVLGLIAWFAAGCGGSSPDGSADPVQPPALTQPPQPAVVRVTAETPYTRALERLCVRTVRAHERVGPSRTTEQLERNLPQSAAIDRRFVRDLSALRPRPATSEKRQAGRLLYLFAAASDIQDSALVHLKADNVNGFFQFMEQSLAARRQAEAVARRLGAPACAVRPFSG